MTLIIAKKTKKHVELVADRRICYGEEYEDVCKKIFKQGNWLVGCSGSHVYQNILMNDQEVTKAFKQSYDMPSIIKNLIAVMINVFSKRGQTNSHKNYLSFDGNVLLVNKSVILKIHSDFSVTSHKKFATIGSGGDYATSLLTFTNMKSSKIIEKVSSLNNTVSKNYNREKLKIC